MESYYYQCHRFIRGESGEGEIYPHEAKFVFNQTLFHRLIWIFTVDGGDVRGGGVS